MTLSFSQQAPRVLYLSPIAIPPKTLPKRGILAFFTWAFGLGVISNNYSAVVSISMPQIVSSWFIYFSTSFPTLPGQVDNFYESIRLIKYIPFKNVYSHLARIKGELNIQKQNCMNDHWLAGQYLLSYSLDLDLYSLLGLESLSYGLGDLMYEVVSG